MRSGFGLRAVMMDSDSSRRRFLQTTGAVALTGGCAAADQKAATENTPALWTPRLSENIGNLEDTTLAWMAQLGLEWVVLQGTDWVDGDAEISGFGAEDGVYLMYDNAYRTANQMAGHISELKLLKDMQPEYFALLEDNLCVVPSDELHLNVNTAGSHALAALSPSLSEAQMLALTEAPRTYSEVSEVTNEYPELAAAADALTVTSEYFEVQVRAQVGESRAELASVLHRDPNDGTLRLIMRDFGRDFRSLYEADAPGAGLAEER